MCLESQFRRRSALVSQCYSRSGECPYGFADCRTSASTFGSVKLTYYRGAEPDDDQYAAIAALG